MSEIFQLILHADETIPMLIEQYGILIYIILFLIIFLETGLVVFNFLPGDGLLVSAGVVAASQQLELSWLIPLLIIATILGNTSNHFIGKFVGMRFFKKEKMKRNEYLSIAFFYYEKYEGGAVVFSRFFPFMRSFVPFVTGISKMKFLSFTIYNMIGGVLWITLYLLIGFYFGEIPWVKENFGKIFIVIVLLFVVVMVVYQIRLILRRKRS